MDKKHNKYFDKYVKYKKKYLAVKGGKIRRALIPDRLEENLSSKILVLDDKEFGEIENIFGMIDDVNINGNICNSNELSFLTKTTEKGGIFKLKCRNKLAIIKLLQLPYIPGTVYNFPRDEYRNEYNITKDVGNHPHVLKCFGVIDASTDRIKTDVIQLRNVPVKKTINSKGFVAIFYEHMNMDLIEASNNRRFIGNIVSRFDNDYFVYALYVYLSCLFGLLRINNKGYLHRDMKLDNIMISLTDDSIQVKIIDFGFARKINDNVPDEVGTLEYVPPEIAGPRQYIANQYTENYSLSVSIAIMLMSEFGMSSRHIFNAVSERNYHKYMDDIALLNEHLRQYIRGHPNYDAYSRYINKILNILSDNTSYVQSERYSIADTITEIFNDMPEYVENIIVREFSRCFMKFENDNELDGTEYDEDLYPQTFFDKIYGYIERNMNIETKQVPAAAGDEVAVSPLDKLLGL